MPTKLVVPMTGRSPDEAHRPATTLELFFDLVFVVAIAQAAAGLHHAIAENHVGEGLLSYTLIFGAIWWAWMNFTWFATSFDTDDVPYRLTIFVQLAGALIMAAGVSVAFKEFNFLALTIGYVVMRVATVTQWLRAAQSHPSQRKTSLRMAFGITFVQILWVGLLFTPEAWFLPGFLVLFVLELIIPVWAWNMREGENWHRGHIAERYGLLTIIVLGESILGASMALQAVIDGQELSFSLVPLMLGGLMTVFALWWLYFDRDPEEKLKGVREAFIWGYGHYFVFAAGAAVGAGIAVAVDHATHHAEISSVAAGMSVAIPVVIFLVSTWLLNAREGDSLKSKLVSAGGLVLVLLAPFSPQPVLLIGLILMGLVALKTVRLD